jgi:DNA-binding transcriptional regulator YdaS (Cro superfamily)
MEHDLKSIFRSRGFRLKAIAEAVGVDKATVTRWVQTRIPAERVADVSQITGLPKSALRPDLWPVDEAAA